MIPHNKPLLDEQDALAVADAVRSGYVAQGERVAAFEKALCELTGVTHASAVSNGAAALHLSLLALGVGSGDEVIIPTYVCTALLNSVNYVGAQAVLADVDLNTYSMDFEDVKSKVTDKTKVIIVPHIFGIPVDIEKFKSLGIPVIEDCAQALGAHFNDKPVGSFGDIAIFSFYATKMATSGQGGMIVTNSKKYIDVVNDLKSYDCRDNYKVRFNYQMTDVHAALGLSQLKKLKDFVSRRALIAEQYTEVIDELNNNDIVAPMVHVDGQVYYRYVLRLKKLDSYVKKFHKMGVSAQNFAKEIEFVHRLLQTGNCSNADEIINTVISIPLYPALADTEVAEVCNVLKTVLGEEQND